MNKLEIKESRLVKADGHFQLRRVITRDGDELLVKSATHDRDGEDKLLTREFELLRTLGPDRAVRALRLARLDGRLAAVYEAFDGVPLVRAPDGSPLTQAALTKLISQLCAIFAILHDRGTHLLCVSPSSFLHHAGDHRLVLVDAPFATGHHQSTEHRPAHRDHWYDSPYLAYAAPELFGVASLPVDHRADLYALGGVLYYLISHQPPFATEEPAEIIQGHLSREPRHLREVAPWLPGELADAVMRLLAKHPRDRFATVDAFKQALALPDIERTPPQIRLRPTIELSTKLYSHTDVAEALAKHVHGVRTLPTVIFLEGEAGIGKTTVLREVQRLESHAYFCTGAFDRATPATPIAGWTRALAGLAHVVLTSPTRELELRRTQIQSQLGEWVPLIGALAPEWQAALGGAAPPTHNLLDASLNRLALAIHGLIGCFAEDEAPVVLVLDDLQWADASSLRLLELIVTTPEPLNLLVLASVRLDDDHPADAQVIHELRDRLAAAGTDVHTRRLAPWTRRDVRQFVTDSLRDEVLAVQDLAELLVDKTHGNPFFVSELLRALVRHHVVMFRAEDRVWRWERDALVRLPVTDNVVSLLTHRIVSLPVDVKDALRIAACLGREFRLSELLAVYGPNATGARRALASATTAGLLVEHDDDRDRSFAFVHDRVLEAALALLSDTASAELHLHIGHVLAGDLATGGDDPRIFKVASHYNAAAHLIDGRAARDASAELNLRAGRQAKLRGAYSQAHELLRAGLAFLGEPGAPLDHAAAWRDRLALTRALYEETAEVSLFNGDHAELNQLCDTLLRHVERPLDKVRAYEIRICGLTAGKQFAAAVDVALEILGALGVCFPRRPTAIHLGIAFLRTRRRVRAGDVDRLRSLPAMTDERISAACRIIQTVYSAAYLGRPALFPLLVFRYIHEALRHGNESYACIAYTGLGVVLASMGQLAEAEQLGQIGLDLLRRFAADRLKARAFMAYYTFIFPWQNPVRDILPFYREGLDAGLAHGDFEYASYIMTLEALARLHTGEALADLEPDFERYVAKLRSLGHERSVLLQNMLCQQVWALRHAPGNSATLSGRFYDEVTDLARCREPLDENLVFHHYLAKLTLAIFLGDPAAAVDAARRGRPHVKSGAFANYLTAMFVTYEALGELLAAYTGRHRLNLRRVRKDLRQLQTWADRAPMNFAHKYHLVAAEYARFVGLGDDAGRHFERAIELSQNHGFTHETGLAQERAASFYLARGMERLGRQYLRESHASYRRWGADVVTRRLEAEYVQQFAILGSAIDGPATRGLTNLADNLDYRTLLKSSQAISGERELPSLLESLLRNILEHAGAQRAVLILDKRGQLYVEAEARVDDPTTEVLGDEKLEHSRRVCRAIVHYSAHTECPMVLSDASRERMFTNDPYVRERQPKSVLCTPILHRGKRIGIAYLENNQLSHVFTEARLEVVNLLAGQAAISIANARFHALEIEAEQAKINPHFLFNALSSIANLARVDGHHAEDAIVKLASLYRYILTNTTGKLVSLDQELEIVRKYLELEKLRHGDKLAYDVTVAGDPSRVRLPGLLIQPLVENSIRHGVGPKLGAGKVTIHAAVHDAKCCIVVEDDGDGGKQATAGTGFGLKSIQQRLTLTYGQRFSFAISRHGGHRVEIEIPHEA